MLSVNAENEIAKLGVLMEAMRSDFRGFGEQLGATNEKLDRVASDVGVLKEQLGDLQVGMRAVRSDVAELKTDVAVLKTDVAVLKDDMRVVKKDVRSVRDDLSSLEPPPKKPRNRR